MGDVHTTRMRCGLGRVREYGVSFAINSIARVVEYTLSNYPMHAIDSESLEMRRKGSVVLDCKVVMTRSEMFDVVKNLPRKVMKSYV